MAEVVTAWDEPRVAAKAEPPGDAPVVSSWDEPKQEAKPSKPSGILNYVPAVPVGETALAMGSGAAGTVLGGLAGLVGTVLPGEPGQGARRTQTVQDALQYEPRTASGQAMTRAVTYLPEKLAQGADWLGGKASEGMTAIGASPEVAAGTGAAVNAGANFLPSLLSEGVSLGARALKPRVASPALERAGKSGYAVTPDEAGAGVIGSTAASLSGEAKLSKNISNKNQSVHVAKISDDLELPKGTELDREATEGVREKQGQAYEVVRKTGKVTVDDAFRTDIENAVKDVKTASEDFPHRKESPILKIAESLSGKDSFDANSAVSEIKNLRKDAKKAFRSGDHELGSGSLDIARALEDVLDRHIEKLSTSNEYGGLQISPEAMDALKKARTMIAKSYAADKALRGTDINPQVYAKMLEDRVPLTGGAREVAEFARDFPRSSQKPSHMAIKGPDWSDIIMAGMSGGKSILKSLGLSTLRPAARAALASDAYQALQRNPDAVRGALASKGFEKGSQAAAIGSVSLENQKRDDQ